MDTKSDFINRVVQEANRIEEDCAYNSTGHFIAAKRWKITDYLLNCPAALLTGLAAFFAFTDTTILIFNSKTIAGILTVIATLLNIAIILLNAGQKSSQHKIHGEKYLALRERARIFRTIKLLYSNISMSDLTKEIVSYSEKKSEINMDSLQLPDWAYKIAKSKIEKGHTTHKADMGEPNLLKEPTDNKEVRVKNV